jgi:hypothetical protein
MAQPPIWATPVRAPTDGAAASRPLRATSERLATVAADARLGRAGGVRSSPARTPVTAEKGGASRPAQRTLPARPRRASASPWRRRSLVDEAGSLRHAARPAAHCSLGRNAAAAIAARPGGRWGAARRAASLERPNAFASQAQARPGRTKRHTFLVPRVAAYTSRWRSCSIREEAASACRTGHQRRSSPPR